MRKSNKLWPVHSSKSTIHELCPLLAIHIKRQCDVSSSQSNNNNSSSTDIKHIILSQYDLASDRRPHCPLLFLRVATSEGWSECAAGRVRQVANSGDWRSARVLLVSQYHGPTLCERLWTHLYHSGTLRFVVILSLFAISITS